MSDPKSVIRFLHEHFEDIKIIYKLYNKNGFIFEEQIREVFSNSLVFDNLIEYEIVQKRVDDSFVLHENFNNFIAFLLDDFSLDMPEQIAKYHKSLSQLYEKLKLKIDKNSTIDVIHSLIHEVHSFENQLQKNIKKLISETKQIKANNKKLDYPQKLQKALYLTDTYVHPLNLILNSHSDSILHIIDNITKEASYQRFNHSDENIKRVYASLYGVFYKIKKQILDENRLLIQEVVPLLDRIKFGSEILSGFINFLNNPKKYDFASLVEKHQDRVYAQNAQFRARDVWEGYKVEEEIFFEEALPLEDRWIYDNEKYIKRLLKAVPVRNFYLWIHEELAKEDESVGSDRFFALSKLIFERDIEVRYLQGRVDIVLFDKIINAPIVEIRRA